MGFRPRSVYKVGAMAGRRYVEPTGADRIFNGAIAALARLGVGVYGARILAVRGRRTGAWRSVPVNVLEHAGGRYLVAPRGETEWVRNLRASGRGELRLGRRRESFRIAEVRDEDKAPLLREYLRRWAFEVKRFFPELSPDAPDASFRGVAGRYPVFRVEPDGPAGAS